MTCPSCAFKDHRWDEMRHQRDALRQGIEALLAEQPELVRDEDGEYVIAVPWRERLSALLKPPCGFCQGRPVSDAATWVDGKPRPPAPCPRCGETNEPRELSFERVHTCHADCPCHSSGEPPSDFLMEHPPHPQRTFLGPEQPPRPQKGLERDIVWNS